MPKRSFSDITQKQWVKACKKLMEWGIDEEDIWTALG